MQTIGHRRYVAALLPFDGSMKIDERGYWHFADNPRFCEKGGLCVNPEAGEIVDLTREEKRRVFEIGMEEAHGKLPSISGRAGRNVMLGR